MEPRLVFAVLIAYLTIAVQVVPCSSTTISPEDDEIIDPTEETLSTTEENISEEEEDNKFADGKGWSAWSEWSECSRSCNGGVTYQLRKCEKKTGCVGEAAKYRICHMQPCPETEDFRSTQCSAYNQIPYRGRFYEWLPYQDPEDPCSLTCHARAFSFVAKLSPSVRDGTRCREGSLDMCVGGKCLPVGCDLQLGSEKKVDECGVCGGDGSTCKRPVYVWNKTPFSPCSVSCGGGYQLSRPTCLNKANDKEVDERLCDVTLRPRPQIKECNVNQCPPVWVTDSWSPCSASCGGGRQSRQVHCAQMGSDGIRTRVDMHECLRQKPLTERPCNLMPCPQWISGPWSGCSVTCGKGQKTRSVACQDAKGHHSEDCDIENMPTTKQDCDSGLVCAASEDPGAYLFPNMFKNSQEDAPPVPPYQSLPWTQKLSQLYTEPSYVAEDWGPCSVTCGQGIRKRRVDCKIFLEFSRTVAKLPDKECPGPKPPDTETCFSRPCSLDQNKAGEKQKSSKSYVGIEVTYSWRVGGFTPCSASCLGGHRESIIQCVRDHDQAVVISTHCDISKKINSITQTCNDHPCPPKWNVSDYTPCTKQCGGGIQTRIVQCLHELTRGTANTLVVANDQCPQPPPRDKQFCNVFDCPTAWKTEPWSKCSKSCGGGDKTRKIRCMREQAFGQIVELAPSSCSKRRPKTQKPCNMKPCPSPDDHRAGQEIYPSHQTYVQERPQRRVFLKVGGTATVFAGTNLKIRCPSRKINKTNIQWFKNDEKIISSRRLKVSMKGALRIRKISYKDGGKYSCVSGHSKADLYINVKPLPPGHGSSEDDKTVERPSDTRQKQKSTEEIFSHERTHTAGATNNRNRNQSFNNSRFGTNQGKSAGRSHEFRGGETVDQNSGESSTNYGRKTYLAGRNGEESHPNSAEKSHENNADKYDFSTLGRVPLYILAGQSTERPHVQSSTTSRTRTGPIVDSDELLPHRGHDRDRNRYKIPDRDTAEKNDIPDTPFPKIIDSWEQRYDGSRRKATQKPFDTWERNHGGALFSDQESGELNIGTPHGGKGFPGLDNEPARSGATSNHAGSHIQQLLVNLHHTLGGTRTRPTVNVHDVEDMNPSDEEDEAGFMDPTNFMANSFVLGKGKAENLEFEWVIGEWSPCSHSCGGNGFQVRASQCLVRLNNVSKTVDSSLCEDAGLKSPNTVQNCGTGDCPHWETAPWSQCLESQCFTWHSSYQKRLIYCRSMNGSDLPLSNCDEKTRPRRKRECYNERCRSTWRVGEWSECTASCSRQGFQSRILQCVWFGSSKPAGNACRDQPRPTVMRPCTGLPCQSSEGRRVHRPFQLLQFSKGPAPMSPESLSSPVL